MQRINFEETRRRFRESGRAPGLFSTARGFNSTTFRQVLRGAYPCDSPTSRSIIAALEEIGVLVWVEEEKKPEETTN
jgi:hypothetical protein